MLRKLRLVQKNDFLIKKRVLEVCIERMYKNNKKLSKKYM